MFAVNCHSGSELMLSDTRHFGHKVGAAMSRDGPCVSRGHRPVEFVPLKEPGSKSGKNSFFVEETDSSDGQNLVTEMKKQNNHHDSHDNHHDLQPNLPNISFCCRMFEASRRNAIQAHGN